MTDVFTTYDYYPFGSIMPGRSFNSSSYRYGFNGYEKDDEVKGSGNSYTTEFRQYDPRLGRWLTIDPLFYKFPWQSPYVAFNNNPIFFADPRGLEGDPPTETNDIGAPDISNVSLKGGTKRFIDKEKASKAFDKDPSDPTFGYIKSGVGYEKIGFISAEDGAKKGSTKGSFFAVKPQKVEPKGLVSTGFGVDIEYNEDGSISDNTLQVLETNIDRLINQTRTSTEAPKGDEQRFPTTIQISVSSGGDTKIEISNANKIAASLQEKYNITISVIVGSPSPSGSVGETTSSGNSTLIIPPGTINTSILFKTFDFGF